MEILYRENSSPRRSAWLVITEFLNLTGSTEERLNELMEIGWLEPRRTAEEALLFRQDDVYRIRKLERLCCDFDLPTLGASIVMDLLERIDQLENRLRKIESAGEDKNI